MSQHTDGRRAGSSLDSATGGVRLPRCPTVAAYRRQAARKGRFRDRRHEQSHPAGDVEPIAQTSAPDPGQDIEKHSPRLGSTLSPTTLNPSPRLASTLYPHYVYHSPQLSSTLSPHPAKHYLPPH